MSFCWVPGHVGIWGNEQADRATKEACREQDVVQCPIPLQSVISELCKKCMELWEEEWLAVTANKLRLVKSTTRPSRSSCRLLRREEVTLTHLRIGHCLLTHSFLLRREDPPFCDARGVHISVRHILTDCILYRDAMAEAQIDGDLPCILANAKTSVSRVLKFCDVSGLWPKLLGWRF